MKSEGAESSSMSFVQVCGENSPDRTLKLFLENNGTLAMSTLQAYFPGATGLICKKEGSEFGMRVIEGFIYFPKDECWADTTFLAIIPKVYYAGLLFVKVCKENSSDGTLEFPLASNGTLALSTLQSQFPGATGLKYKKEGSDGYRVVRVAEGFIYPLEDESWANTNFVAMFPKSTTCLDSAVACVERFRASLKQGNIGNPEKGVIALLIERYPYNLIAAASEVDSAVKLYYAAKALPGSSTRAVVRESLGISINGNLDPTYPNRIFIGYEGLNQIILKVPTAKEIEMYQLMFGDSSKEEMAANHLVHCKLVSVRNSAELKSSMQYPELCSVSAAPVRFEALQMDRYLDTLRRSLQVARQDDLHSGALQIEVALKFIHSKGFVHMDVKGDNILFTNNGNWFLGDFDSCVAVGQEIRSTTENYYPVSLRGKCAQFMFDWYMLVVALAIEVVKIDQQWHEKLFNEEFVVDNRKLKAVIIEHVTSSSLRDFMLHYQAIGYSE